MKGLFYILESIPAGNYLLDYKKEKITQILDMLDKDSILKTYETVFLRALNPSELSLDQKKNRFFEYTEGNLIFDKNCNGMEDNKSLDIAKHIALESAKKLKSKENILSILSIDFEQWDEAVKNRDIDSIQELSMKLSSSIEQILPNYEFIQFLIRYHDEDLTSIDKFVNYIKNLY